MTRSLYFAVTCALLGTSLAATTIPACGKCLPRNVALIAASGAGTVTPTVKMLANTAAGCRQMNVICTAPAGGTIASMEFNRRLGGPYEAKTVIALVKCGADQKWRFSKNGAVILVNSVGCMYV
ncbi:hypothetical protein ANCCAN_02707 [Ancylostoma caninum]|uniref:C6 domain-containing protein n=1 Tax=Ancylostoma caninum TaxID=29170 RepID=A0A368H3F6_ANCCA|nr:hypothetical protein ANCCAN_02707 [Ancylostoma caninum]